MMTKPKQDQTKTDVVIFSDNEKNPHQQQTRHKQERPPLERVVGGTLVIFFLTRKNHQGHSQEMTRTPTVMPAERKQLQKI